MFAWKGAASNGSQQAFGNTVTFSNYVANTSPVIAASANQAGASFRNLTIIGNRSSNQPQRGLAFYGSTQWVYIDNCSFSYLRGMAIGAGEPSSASSGNFTESRIQNCHINDDGDAATSTPAIEITSSGGESSNSLDLVNLRFFDNWGPSMQIHGGTSPSNNPTDIRMLNDYFEESGMSQQTAVGDELQLGDSTYGISEVYGRNILFENPLAGYAALHVETGPSVGLYTSNIDIAGDISATSASGGRGLQIDSCRSCSFEFGSNTASDYQLVLGSISGTTCSASNQAGQPIIYDGGGNENLLTTCIDPAAVGLVQYPVRQFLVNANSVNPPYAPLSDLTSSVALNASATFRTVLNSTALPDFLVSINSPLWIVIRSVGPSSGTAADKWDTAANVVAALNAPYSPSTPVAVGQVYHARVCNQMAVTETVGPNTNETGNTVTIPTGSCASVIFTITSIATPAINIYGTTTGG